MKKTFMLLIFSLCGVIIFAHADNLPTGFVYLKDVAPSIQQDIR
jgi:hypothetical protein